MPPVNLIKGSISELKGAASGLNRLHLCLLILLVTKNVHAELRFITTVEPPTNYVHEGKFSGMTTEIVKAIRDQLGWSNQVEVYPWARGYQLALTTPNSVIFTAGKTPERVAAGFYFVGPVSTRQHVVFTRSGQESIEVEDIRRSQIPIAGLRGGWRGKHLSNQGFNIIATTEHDQGFRMLMNRRINYWISSDMEAPMIAKKWGYRMSDLKIAWMIKEAKSYMAISPGSSQHLITRWETTYQALQKQDFFPKEVTRWSDILDADVKFSETSGYIIHH